MSSNPDLVTVQGYVKTHDPRVFRTLEEILAELNSCVQLMTALNEPLRSVKEE